MLYAAAPELRCIGMCWRTVPAHRILNAIVEDIVAIVEDIVLSQHGCARR
jgi:hypothetical protein